MNNLASAQSWYFQSQSDVLTINDYTKRVGVKQPNPQHTLDVNGDISASNILSINVVTDNAFIHDVTGCNLSYSNIVAEHVVIDNCFSLSNYTNYIDASQGVIDDLHCITVTTSSNVRVGSNLALLNTWLNQPCPIPSAGTLFGFSLGGGGWIDPSWIKPQNDFMGILDSMWNLAQTGWDIATFGNSVFNPDKTIGNDLKDALKETLDGGDSNDVGKIYVDWGNVKHKPLYADKVNYNVGVKGNLYLNEAQSLYSLNSSYFSVGNQLNMNMTSSNGAVKLLDVGTKEAFFNTLNIGSNVYISVNSNSVKINNYMFSSNAITNSNASISFSNDTVGITKLNTSNVSTSNILCQNFTVNNTGIWANLANPLLTQQMFDANGTFKGTVTKAQITDLEALDLGKLADGLVSWNSFSSANVPSIFDPFVAVTSPLYEIV